MFRASKALPDELPFIVGDLFHNLRSGLDHAITDLTIAYTGEVLARTEFPVFTQEEAFDATSRRTGEPVPGSGLYKIRGVGPRCRRLIRAAQGFDVETEALSAIHVIQDRKSVV